MTLEEPQLQERSFREPPATLLLYVVALAMIALPVGSFISNPVPLDLAFSLSTLPSIVAFAAARCVSWLARSAFYVEASYRESRASFAKLRSVRQQETTTAPQVPTAAEVAPAAQPQRTPPSEPAAGPVAARRRVRTFALSPLFE